MLLDTSAWIEFFMGSTKGERVREVLKKEFCHTSILTLAEVSKWCFKNNFDTNKHIDAIQQTSSILSLNNSICVLAGKITVDSKKIMPDFGLVDGIIAATAQLYDLQILTGDGHFKGLGAELL